jgi:hypothetical protein
MEATMNELETNINILFLLLYIFHATTIHTVYSCTMWPQDTENLNPVIPSFEERLNVDVWTQQLHEQLNTIILYCNFKHRLILRIVFNCV